MKKYFLFLFICILVPIFAQAQQSSTTKDDTIKARNALLFESLGGGIGASLNYDYRFYGNGSVILRGGTSYFATNASGGTVNVMTMPLLFCVAKNLWIRHNPIYIELGVGATLYSSLNGGAGHFSIAGSPAVNPTGAFLTTIAGLRWEENDGGIIAEIALTPLFIAGKDISYGGIGLGYAF